MVMKYSRDRGYYSTAEAYPCNQPACFWMVTALYNQMRSTNLSEAEHASGAPLSLKNHVEAYRGRPSNSGSGRANPEATHPG